VESELETNHSRLELAVLVFPDFNESFSRGRSAHAGAGAIFSRSSGRCRNKILNCALRWRRCNIAAKVQYLAHPRPT